MIATESPFNPYPEGYITALVSKHAKLTLHFSKYYRKNKKIPVFAYDKKGFIPEEALQLISGVSRKHSADVCTDHPVGCMMNATFLVDTSKLQHPQDIKADDLGTFKNNRVQHRYCFATADKDDGNELITQRLPVRHSECRPGHYDVKVTYWVHSSHNDFKRRLYQVIDMASTEALPHVLLQYMFDDEEHESVPCPHGSSFSQKPYRRSSASMKIAVA